MKMKMTMTKANRGGLVSAVMTMFLLVGCAANLPSQRLPDLTYSHLRPLTFDVGSIIIALDYKAPLAAPNVDHMFAVPPAEALQRWVNGRLKTSGGGGDARFTITDASVIETTLPLKKGLTGAFTKEQSERYEARIEAQLEIRDGSGMRLGFAQASVKRSITVREDANINERELAWFKLTESLMNDFDAEMEKEIRRHLSKWLKS